MGFFILYLKIVIVTAVLYGAAKIIDDRTP
jgi:hypothetical protein